MHIIYIFIYKHIHISAILTPLFPFHTNPFSSLYQVPILQLSLFGYFYSFSLWLTGFNNTCWLGYECWAIHKSGATHQWLIHWRQLFGLPKKLSIANSSHGEVRLSPMSPNHIQSNGPGLSFLPSLFKVTTPAVRFMSIMARQYYIHKIVSWSCLLIIGLLHSLCLLFHDVTSALEGTMCMFLHKECMW